MSLATVTLLGRDYRLACDDGQEERLRELAYEVDDRMRRLRKQMGGTEAPNISQEMLLLVLTAITMADELSDVKQEATRLHEELASTSHSFERSKRIELERTLAGTINGIAERLERIADRLEAE